MSEEKLTDDFAGDTTHSGVESGPAGYLISVGDQLRAARESRGLSINEVSSVLKLSPRQVEELEANEWTRLPKTIIRGFVRNYARYLELEAAPLMASLDNMPLPQGPELEVQIGAPVSMPKEGRADRRDYVRVLAGLIVLVLAVVAYFLLPLEMWHSGLESIKAIVQSRTASESVVAPVTTPTDNLPGTGTSPAPVAVPPNAPSAVSPVSPPETEKPSPVPGPSSSSGEALVFAFAQPSWVEVRDRSGQIIFSQLSQAGSRRDINGQSPFSLVVGNASHVTLQYKGKPVDLSKRSKDDVVRLTLE